MYVSGILSFALPFDLFHSAWHVIATLHKNNAVSQDRLPSPTLEVGASQVTGKVSMMTCHLIGHTRDKACNALFSRYRNP